MTIKVRKWSVGILLLLMAGCVGRQGKTHTVVADDTVSAVWINTALEDRVRSPDVFEDTETEKRMRALGLVDIREIEPSVRVQLMYATADNFVGKVLYRDIHKAFLLPEAARKLADAQRRLKILRPDLSLLVYDAARPMSVQQEMWERVKGTDKRVFVSNPKNGGGLHNYGAAVDLSIVDSLGNALPMGCGVDYFGDEARPDKEEEMLKQGRIILPHVRNRRLLREVMTEAGFRALPGEWWHFNLMSRDEAREMLTAIK